MCRSAAGDKANPAVSLITRDTPNIAEIRAQAEALPGIKQPARCRGGKAAAVLVR